VPTNSYQPQPDADTEVRVTALQVVYGDLAEEIAATLVDEDEAAFPGSWADAGYDRGGAISEYLAEIDRLTNTTHERN
jgi:hypothetical protein